MYSDYELYILEHLVECDVAHADIYQEVKKYFKENLDVSMLQASEAAMQTQKSTIT
jgi:hypothetical protein